MLPSCCSQSRLGDVSYVTVCPTLRFKVLRAVLLKIQVFQLGPSSQRRLFLKYLILKMKALQFFQMSETIYPGTQHIPEDLNLLVSEY